MFEDGFEVRDRLAALVDRLDPDAMSGPAAGELWGVLDASERLCAAGKTLLARRIAQTHRPETAGVKTAAEVLARRAGTTVGAARDAVDTSARLPELPLVEAAVRRGELSPAQAAAVTGAASADPTAEQRLLDLAASASLPELRDEAARVAAAADPDPEATHWRLHRRRALRRFTGADGAWTLIAKGTPQAGAAINTALDPIIDQIFAAARREGRREPYEAYAFDALVRLTTGQHPAGPDRGGPGPAVTGARAAITAGPAAEATRATGVDVLGLAVSGARAAITAGPATEAAPVAGPPPTQPPAAPRRPNPRYLALLRIDIEALRRGAVAGQELCEIAGIGPVPVTVARDLLGQAIVKLVITRGVDVANITHLGRGPTIAQKIALMWANPTCIAEGCHRRRIEYDHRTPWKDTRHTRQDELDGLCAYHHDLKTRLGWALTPGHGKRPFVPPDDPRHPRHLSGRHPRQQRDPATIPIAASGLPSLLSHTECSQPPLPKSPPSTTGPPRAP